MWSVYKLGKNEGIWNRPTESGSRWQTAGSFAVDDDGVVRWVQVARGADDVAELAKGVEVLEAMRGGERVSCESFFRMK